MRTPVYRHLGAKSGLFGLSVLEWAPLLLVAWAGMAIDRPNSGVLLAALAYAGLRAASQGRSEGFVQHFLLWRTRQAKAGGRLSAAARGHAPRFPFADYGCRDRAARGDAP